MPEVLLEDDPPPKRRSRWVDIAGLGAVVAGMLAIGVLGDRGDREERADPLPTTTTTERVPRTVPYGPRTATSTTSTTVLGRRVLGPLAPRETRTVLLVHRGSGAELVEVDTGIVIPVGNLAGETATAMPGGFVLQGQQLDRLRLDGTVDDFLELGNRWPLGATSQGIWMVSDGRATEHGPDGAPTGREVAVPPSAYPSHVTERGVVIGQADSITLATFEGELRSLGTGAAMAAAGDVLVKLTCELLRCELQVVELASGFTRAVRGFEGLQGELAAVMLSPEGRWLVVRQGQGDGTWSLVDVQEALHAEERPLPGAIAGIWGGGLVAFGPPGSDALFSTSGDQVRFHDLRTGAWYPLEGIVGLDVRALAATAR